MSNIIHEYSTQITTDWEGWINEVPLTVYYNYTPAKAGKTGEFGVPEEPDEPACVEIVSIMHEWFDCGHRQLVDTPHWLMNDMQREELRKEITAFEQEME